jgi:hypothetical protein
VGEAPDFSTGVVDQAKVVDYLLGDRSIASRAKARFFGALGFSASRWEALADALREQANVADVSAIASPWGAKYIALGEIDAPIGRRYKIISVWIAEGPMLRLITAYPAKEASHDPGA